ncbi:MAG: hypothetical protein ABL982_03990 [Vicinamibacterales bacterium]
MATHPSSCGDLLPSPYEVDLGTGISANDLDIRIGERPFAVNLQRLYLETHGALPPEIAVFDQYDVWLVCHAIGCMRRRGSASIRSFGYRARLMEGQPRVYTADVFPRTEFIKRSEGQLVAQVDLGMDGSVSLPHGSHEFVLGAGTGRLGGGLQLSTRASWVGRLTFAAHTAKVVAIGVGATNSEWMLEVDDEPLLGDQLLYQTVLVPPGTRSLRYAVTAYAMIRPRWIGVSARYETDEVVLTVPLD